MERKGKTYEERGRNCKEQPMGKNTPKQRVRDRERERERDRERTR